MVRQARAFQILRLRQAGAIIRSVTLEGQLLIADPNSLENTQIPWDYETIVSGRSGSTMPPSGPAVLRIPSGWIPVWRALSGRNRRTL